MRHVHIFAGFLVLVVTGCSGSHNSIVPISSSPAGSGQRLASVNTSGPYPTAVLSNSPVAYYRLGDQNSTATDSSGNGRNGTYSGLGASLTQGTAGLITNDTTTSTTDNGNGAGVVNVSRNAAFESTSKVTVEAWVKLSGNTSGWQTLVQYGNRSNSFRGYALNYDGPHGAFAFKIAASVGSGPSTTVEPTSGVGFHPEVGTVYYLAGTYDGATIRLYVNGQLSASAALAGSISYAPPVKAMGLTIFEDIGGASPTSGALQEIAFYNTTLSASTIANHYAQGTGTTPPSSSPSPSPPPTPAPSPTPAYSDWATFGDNLQRTNNNASETTLSRSNVSSLKLSWPPKPLDGTAITDQPLVAKNINVGGTPTTVIYVGTEGGTFWAINAANGATIWERTKLGTVSSGCMDLPGGKFGITGTATYDKSINRIFVADGQDQVHRLDMSTGAEDTTFGWPVTVTNQFTSNHIYGALSLNTANHMLYVETASFCDNPTWNGRIVGIANSNILNMNASIVATFMPGMINGVQYNGAGIWGIGGPAIDSIGDVYVTTGNTENGVSQNGLPAEAAAYGDQVVHLDSSLNVKEANYPGFDTNLTDLDFGATPMLYNPPGCAQVVTAKNKSGAFFSYITGTFSNGPIQSLIMAPPTNDGIFIGTTAYAPPPINLVYVGDPVGNATYQRGLVALAPQADCTLSSATAFNQTIGPIGPTGVTNDNDSATVANGVVYFTDGIGNEVFAFDAVTGAQLWRSSQVTTINGPVQVAPTVDGRLIVASWDGHLYVFGVL